jgi:hypothetical protein
VSQLLVSAVWKSSVPTFLKRGVLGAMAAWASDDGTFTVAPTVAKLTKHRYLREGRLTRRTVQYQLRACERLGVLLPIPYAGGQNPRPYVMSYLAITTLTAEEVAADKPVRHSLRKGRNGCAPFDVENRGATKGATKGATDAEKGRNEGRNEGRNGAGLRRRGEILRSRGERRAVHSSTPKPKPATAGLRFPERLCQHEECCRSFTACRDLILAEARQSEVACA